MATDNVPKNIELEQEILGIIFLEDGKPIKEMADEVKVDYFFHPSHKEIYNAMLYLHHQNKNIEYTVVIDRLKTKKSTVKSEYILNLTESVINVDNFDSKLVVLKDLYEKRELYRIAEYITKNDISGVSSENLTKKIKDVMDNFKVTSNIEVTKASDYIDKWFEELKTPLDNSERYLFGFKALDEMVMMDKGNLITISAMAGQGKSIFALNIVKNLCLQGYKTTLISLEMSEKELMDRAVANMSKVSVDEIRKRTLTTNELARVSESIEEIKNFKWTIFDKGFMNVDHLYNLTKKMHKENNLDVLVVDYLGLLDGGKHSSRNHEISYITRRLKQLAQELSIPIIQLSQLNRNVVGRDGKIREPQLADLRDSGSVEQDSNAVIFLHPKNKDTEKYENKFLKLIVRKNRNGRIGDIDFEFVGDTMTFIEKEWVDGKAQPVKQLNLKELKNKKSSKDIVINDDLLPF